MIVILGHSDVAVIVAKGIKYDGIMKMSRAVDMSLSRVKLHWKVKVAPARERWHSYSLS